MDSSFFSIICIILPNERQRRFLTKNYKFLAILLPGLWRRKLETIPCAEIMIHLCYMQYIHRCNKFTYNFVIFFAHFLV
jgi:hypothetical protein